MDEAHHNHALPAGTRLDNYITDRPIGGGGFSIVYLGHVVHSDIQVVIKEYMPRKLARRDEDGRTVKTRSKETADSFSLGQRMFFQEASTLASVKHPNIVNVINFFRANGTVYMVMAYEEGVNLQEYVRRHPGGLSETLLRTVFPRLLTGLQALHQKGLLHLDIKPGNVYLRPGGDPILLDFGAVHAMQKSRKYQASQVVTPGFSPVEQSAPGGYVGPWTDLYAIGATMRACIEGATPPPAEERRMKECMKPAVEQFRRRYSRGLLAAIDWAMEVDPELRPQSVEAFLAALERDDAVPPPRDTLLGRLNIPLPWGKE